ncbi:MAG: phenylalanine--tRNA ligase subunit beta [Candidatus Woesearchaeota archaeon]|nr:phenylalanine--tRNA ligase subunit beta [Candidatus Woesearchaeota archaeon]
MPTITFSFKDLQKLAGKKISAEELSKFIEYGKGELKSYDEKEDEVSVDFDDTNLPYLWSAEGIARLIKGISGKEKGIPKLKIEKSNYKLVVDRSVNKVRPYIAAFVAKGCKVDDYLLKQIIQLQEKLCETYGKKRQKLAVGLYSYKKITFPVIYKATDPESIKFIPLDFRKEMTQSEILEEHPKGKEYAWILKDFSKYPILIDSKKEVLSFPPIINSSLTGKVEIGEEDLFFECTGTDLDSVNLAANIFAQAFYERGFKIYSVNIKYPNKTIKTPFMFNETIKIKKEQIKEMLGLDLKDSEVKVLAEKAGYNFKGYKIEIPCYRKDILHPVDIIEDIAIMYGYDKIGEEKLKSYTIGETKEIINFVDKIREIIIGLGYQEIMSPLLSNKEILYEKMNIKDFGTVELENYMSENYSAVRSWLLPILMEVLAKNKHIDYPQKIFEQGIVTVRNKEEIKDYERIAVLAVHDKADFTEIKQVFDHLFRCLGLQYVIEDADHSSFIEGRVGRISVNGIAVAYIGEVHPAVLGNFNLEMPVVGFELNITDLFEAMKKKE